MWRRVLLCLQGCDSSMWVRAAPGATSPQGPLQDSYNSSPRADAIAGIPTRNRDAFAQGTDTLAAALQSIHQSQKGVVTAKGQSSHPTARLWKGQGHQGWHWGWHHGGDVKLPDSAEIKESSGLYGSHFAWPDNRKTLHRVWKILFLPSKTKTFTPTVVYVLNYTTYSSCAN